jgi:bifunctional non-homologous end joining protein LigD
MQGMAIALDSAVVGKTSMDKVPFRVSPMLATLVDQPFSKEGWVFEEKYDGVRMLAYKEGHKVSLVSRNGIDRSNRYPTITGEVAKLNARTLLLDGEIVVFDARKVSRFQLLQQGKGKAQYAVFDCLQKNGKDLRREALSARRTEYFQQIIFNVRMKTRSAET